MSDPGPILIVDDDEDDFFFTRRALRKVTPAAIFHVENGSAAVEYLAGTGPYMNRVEFPFPKLVFLDLKMDGVSGHEVLQWVRTSLAAGERPKIVVLTGSNEPTDRHAVKATGVAAGYFVKPITAEDVAAVLRMD